MSVKTKRSAVDLVRQEIRIHKGLPFRSFMDLALYHPAYGYYQRSQAQRGRSGDYYTSVQVSDIFPRIFADVFLQMREELGTEQFHIIEVGAGGGEFLERVLSAFSEKGKLKGFHVWIVEKGRVARDQIWKKLSRFPKVNVLSSIEEIDFIGGVEGCIFSNEFFDAIPFDRLRYCSNQWKEIWVVEKDGQLQEEERDLSSPSLLQETRT